MGKEGGFGNGGQLEEGGSKNKMHARKKFLQGSARGQCPMVLYEADGGRRAQQEGAAGEQEEDNRMHAKKKAADRTRRIR